MKLSFSLGLMKLISFIFVRPHQVIQTAKWLNFIRELSTFYSWLFLAILILLIGGLWFLSLILKVNKPSDPLRFRKCWWLNFILITAISLFWAGSHSYNLFVENCGLKKIKLILNPIIVWSLVMLFLLFAFYLLLSFIPKIIPRKFKYVARSIF